MSFVDMLSLFPSNLEYFLCFILEIPLVLTRLASFKCSSANHKVFDISFIISANCDTILLYFVSQRGEQTERPKNKEKL